MSAKPSRKGGKSAPSKSATHRETENAVKRGAEHKRDMLLVHGVSEEGDAYHVLRAREDRLEAGVVRPLKEGQPLDGEVVKLTPRPEAPVLFDVDVQVPRKALNVPGSATKGPAQVASDPYRANWDRIWKKGRKKSLPN